ncbi:MAG: hypothetical protein WCV81_03905 [Microgenomates group bacterium]|jgi:guanylate kinase
MEQTGKLIVITGATVSGKDTVVASLLKAHPFWKRVVTTTTRPIRTEETNGIDYNFIDKETFQKMKENDEFLETVEYADNYYGTTKSILDPALQGQILIWRIDASRAAQVNKLFEDSFDAKIANYLKANTKVIYLKLENNSVRQKHFLERGMIKDDINKRLKQDEIDYHVGNFKNIVINYEGKLEQTMASVEEIINS